MLGCFVVVVFFVFFLFFCFFVFCLFVFSRTFRYRSFVIETQY